MSLNYTVVKLSNLSYRCHLIFIDFKEVECQELLLSGSSFYQVNKLDKVCLTFRKKRSWEHQINRIILQTKSNKII